MNTMAMKHPLNFHVSSLHQRQIWKMKSWNRSILIGFILCLFAMMPMTGRAGRVVLRDKAEQMHEPDSSLRASGLTSSNTKILRTGSHAAPAVQCYSCMSKTMGSLWEAAELDKIYMQQQSFTDHCLKPEEHRPPVFVRQCSFTCISMLIEVQFGMGAKTQLRGCYDSIFRSGFNESSPASTRLKYKDFCHKFNLSEVIKQRLKYDSVVEICSCRGQFCNGGIMPTSGAARTGVIGSMALFKLVITSLIYYVWRN